VADAELKRLVAQLPERYQPIYGLGDDGSSRAANLPRTTAIVESTERLSRHIGRELRVLDLGSSQGYMAFLLAERGHHVTGIDYLPINVDVARAIQRLHPDLDTAFVEGDLSDTAMLVDLDRFDVVLGLSVLHHIVYRDGLDRAVELVAQLSRHIDHGLFEMALRPEPMYWAERQPCDPRVVLADYPFIREIAVSPTHLSDIHRPLLFCSTSLALLNDELHPIRSYSESSHGAAPDLVRGRRRYFTLDAGLMKIAARFADDSGDEGLTLELREELRHEAAVLADLAGSDVTVPTVLEFVDTTTETVIAKTMYQGELVSAANHKLDQDARLRITDDVISELARYEALGWHHTDLRLWNIVWDEVGAAAHLIDHGALQREPGDVVWPGDAPYSFAAFLCALWSVADDRTGLEAPRALPIGDVEIPTKVVRMLEWVLRQPRSRRFFRDAQVAWSSTTSEPSECSPWPPLAWEWLVLFGEHLDELAARHDELSLENQAAYDRLHREYDEAIAGYERLHARYDGALASYARLEDLYNTATAALDELRTHHELLAEQQREERGALEAANRRLAEIESSRSWRLTQPLRSVRRLLRR
jgi:O-antigen chain-terminating methyltransferase